MSVGMLMNGSNREKVRETEIKSNEEGKGRDEGLSK